MMPVELACPSHSKHCHNGLLISLSQADAQAEAAPMDEGAHVDKPLGIDLQVRESGFRNVHWMDTHRALT